jgi:hypothetical protein
MFSEHIYNEVIKSKFINVIIINNLLLYGKLNGFVDSYMDSYRVNTMR